MATTPVTPVAFQDVTITWAMSVLTALAEKLLKEGDSMTGPLTITIASGTAISVDGTVTADILLKQGGVTKGAITARSTGVEMRSQATTDNLLLMSGGTAQITLSGGNTITTKDPITLPGAPTANLEAATKLYVDTLTINAQTGTTYTLVISDQGKLVTLNNASAIALSVPLNSSVAFPIGTQIQLAQLGAGRVTVSGTGVVGTPSLQFRAQYSAASLIKYGTDNWLLVGDLLIP